MPLVIIPRADALRMARSSRSCRSFFLAIKAQVDIVPVALVELYGLLPMNT